MTCTAQCDRSTGHTYMSGACDLAGAEERAMGSPGFMRVQDAIETAWRDAGYTDIPDAADLMFLAAAAALSSRPGPAVTATGAAMVAAERHRQVSVEGWSVEHDDEHQENQLALAAVCYATPDERRGYSLYKTTVPAKWPWPDRYWKPCPYDRIRELVKAGALIAAEIDRLVRVGMRVADTREKTGPTVTTEGLIAAARSLSRSDAAHNWDDPMPRQDPYLAWAAAALEAAGVSVPASPKEERDA